MLQEMEQEIVMIRHNLKAAQDRHKIYAYLKRMHKEFQVGDHVYLRLNPNKSSLKLGSSAKLAPRYCGTFEILDRIGPVTYRISFLASMRVHNVSMFL